MTLPRMAIILLFAQAGPSLANPKVIRREQSPDWAVHNRVVALEMGADASMEIRGKTAMMRRAKHSVMHMSVDTAGSSALKHRPTSEPGNVDVNALIEAVNPNQTQPKVIQRKQKFDWAEHNRVVALEMGADASMEVQGKAPMMRRANNDSLMHMSVDTAGSSALKLLATSEPRNVDVHDLIEAVNSNQTGLATVAAGGTAAPQELLALARRSGQNAKCGVNNICEPCAGTAKNMFCSFQKDKYDDYYKNGGKGEMLPSNPVYSTIYECKDICTIAPDELRGGSLKCFASKGLGVSLSLDPASFESVQKSNCAKQATVEATAVAQSMTTHAMLGRAAVFASAFVCSVNALA